MSTLSRPRSYLFFVPPGDTAAWSESLRGLFPLVLLVRGPVCLSRSWCSSFEGSSLVRGARCGRPSLVGAVGTRATSSLLVRRLFLVCSTAAVFCVAFWSWWSSSDRR